MSRAVNAIVIGIAAMIVIVGVFWFFSDYLGTQTRDADARPQGTDGQSSPGPTTGTQTTTRVETTVTTGTSSETFTSTGTFTETITQTYTQTPTQSSSGGSASNGTMATGGDGSLAAAAPPPSLATGWLPAAAVDPSNIIRDFMEQASLALILGGLLMLGFVVSLVMIRAMFSPGSDVGPRFRRPDPLKRAARPTPDLAPTAIPAGPPHHPPNPSARQEGRDLGRRLRARTWPDALTTLASQGLGDLRLLHLGDHDARLRIYACRECQAGRHTHPQGCSQTLGWIEGIVATFSKQPRVRETACTVRGGAVCEFEVRY